MKKILLVLFLFMPLTAGAVDATPWTTITRIEARSVDLHDIYVADTIPTQNCSYNDRALIDVSTSGGKVMMSVVLAALMSGKNILLKVDGCLSYAPKAVTILIEP